MGVAAALFLGLFVVGPAVLFDWLQHIIGSGLVANVLEGVFRVALFLGYLAVIGRPKDIRRVFQYHGAELELIAAYEHGEPLQPESVDRYSTLHVRCGTNFLLIVMILTIVVFAFFGTPSIGWRIASASSRFPSSPRSPTSSSGSAPGTELLPHPGGRDPQAVASADRPSHPMPARSRSRSPRSRRSSGRGRRRGARARARRRAPARRSRAGIRPYVVEITQREARVKDRLPE